jgi:hypothetical protein
MLEVVARAIVVFLVTFGVALAVFWVVKNLGFDFDRSWQDGRIGAAAVAAVVAVADAIRTSTRRLPTSR